MEGFSLQYGKNGLWYGVFSHFAAAGIKHGISTRFGGSSRAPFASLNLALHTGDEPQMVVANRQTFCQTLGMNFSRLVTAQQVHSDSIAIITEQEIGRGREAYAEALLNTDALITQLIDVPLMLFFADCVPVLLVDPIRRVIGVSHAGWKGTVSLIAQKTVLAMQKCFGTRPADCLVGIAPSIGPCCYEVDDVVVDRLKENFTDWQSLLIPQNKRWRLNLWEANVRQLADIGVLKSNIVVSEVCTACNSDMFFSYRADQGHTGRIAAVISL